MRLGIDPGHGGTNKGCVGSNMHEETVTLQTALALQHLLSLIRPAWHVTLSRSSDETVHFAERAKRLLGSDLILSLHYDSNQNPTTGHMAGYCFPGDETAYGVGFHILQVAPPALTPPKPADALHLVNNMDWTVRAYNVLEQHRPAPALLIEVGFLSNPAHAALIASGAGMVQIATSLISGLLEMERNSATYKGV